MKRLLLPLVCLCGLLLVGGARANTSSPLDLTRLWVPLSEHVMLSMPGALRAHGGYASSLDVQVADPEKSDAVSQQTRLHMRLRFAPALMATGRGWPVFEMYRIGVDGDVLWDVVTPREDSWTSHEPRADGWQFTPKPRLMGASFSALGPYIGLNVGIMRSHWGTGLLANHGLTSDPLEFGWGRYADRVARAQLLFFPLGTPRGDEDVFSAPAPLTLSFAADAVVEDDTASWLDGDRAFHAVMAALGVIDDFKVGVYAVHRRQDHAGGGDTEVTALDLYLKKSFHAGLMDMFAELEVAVMFGSTSYSQSALTPGRFSIESGGGVLRVGGSIEGFKALMEAGFASGDDNPYDTRLTAFSFDREYKVGLLMFRQTLRQMTAAAALNVQDPTYRGQPPRGYERIATSGSVRGAAYINPKVSYTFEFGLSLAASYLHARSAGHYADPFQSSLNGGLPTGPKGALLQNLLGDEFDVAVSYDIPTPAVALRVKAEAAVYQPGEVFATQAQGTQPLQYGAWMTGELIW